MKSNFHQYRFLNTHEYAKHGHTYLVTTHFLNLSLNRAGENGQQIGFKNIFLTGDNFIDILSEQVAIK